ncbi:hypothetical protein LT493_30285 [Streptomyces tricolor]|nr:hypothetical protein [Streptomyces tricolor]
MLPGVSSVLETTIAYEQVAVDLTAWVARMEPDPYLKQAYEFGVLEDFDHLYRYANLYEMIEHRKAESIVDNLTEVMPGRPALPPPRSGRQRPRPVRQGRDEPAVQAARADDHVGGTADDELLHKHRPHLHGADRPPALPGDRAHRGGARHPLRGPSWTRARPGGSSWSTTRYNECYLYYSFMEQETDPKVKAIWELHLNMELEHLHTACELMRRHDGREPQEVLAPELPNVLTFEPNKQYLRELLDTQMDLTTLGAGYVREAHERFEKMQEQIHGGEAPPSDRVIAEHDEMFGREYRVQTEGEHPDPAQREK